MEVQIQKYEADIRRHISIEHQLQLYTDDLKRSVTLLQVEKTKSESDQIALIDELKRDKSVLREFMKIKDQTITDLNAKLGLQKTQIAQLAFQQEQQKQRYETQLKDLKQKLSICINQNIKTVATPLAQLSTEASTSQKQIT